MKWLGNERRFELLVFALALALRLGWVAIVQVRGGALFGPDAPSYDQLAIALLEGKGLQKWDYQGLFSDEDRAIIVRSFRPPLLPILLAGVYGIAGQSYAAARVVMAILGAAGCVVVMRIARRLFGPSEAAIAGLLTAAYPRLIYYSGEIVTEAPYIFLLTVVAAVLLRAREADNLLWRWPGAGALMGLATLCRSALLGFLPFACLWAVLVQPRKLRGVGNAALLAGGFAVVMAPWWGRNAAIHGRFVPATTEGGFTLWVTNNDRADGGGHCFWPAEKRPFDTLSEAEIDERFREMGWAWIQGHPGRFLELAASKFVRFWRLWPHASEPSVGLLAAIVAGATFTPVLILAILGAVAARHRWREHLLIYLLFLYYTLLHMALMAITRYRLPLEPFLIIFAAHGLVELWKRRTPTSQ